MCRFVARAVLWKVLAWSASCADLLSSASVLSIFASITSTFSCLRAREGGGDFFHRQGKDAIDSSEGGRACTCALANAHDTLDCIDTLLNLIDLVTRAAPLLV
jgi:hypothetical protein